MITRYGVTLDGESVHSMVDTAAEALAVATRATKTDGLRRYVVRVVPLKRVTSTAQAPPEPLVEDE